MAMVTGWFVNNSIDTLKTKDETNAIFSIKSLIEQSANISDCSVKKLRNSFGAYLYQVSIKEDNPWFNKLNSDDGKTLKRILDKKIGKFGAALVDCKEDGLFFSFEAYAQVSVALFEIYQGVTSMSRFYDCHQPIMSADEGFFLISNVRGDEIEKIELIVESNAKYFKQSAVHWAGKNIVKVNVCSTSLSLYKKVKRLIEGNIEKVGLKNKISIDSINGIERELILSINRLSFSGGGNKEVKSLPELVKLITGGFVRDVKCNENNPYSYTGIDEIDSKKLFEFISN